MTLKRRETESKSESDSKSLVQPSGSPLLDLKRRSHARIYEAMMRSGGEPFGAPFETGVSSLTTKVVHFFKLTGFFGFETVEKLRQHNQRNRFTRHGAAPYTGELAKPKPPKK